jgi:anti-anti-sigma factor
MKPESRALKLTALQGARNVTKGAAVSWWRLRVIDHAARRRRTRASGFRAKIPNARSLIQNETNDPTIEVEFRALHAPAFAAVVRLRGEHDLATGRELRAALKPIDGNVLVDFTECSFIDSAIIAVLIEDHQARIREGQRLELLVPPEHTHVSRTLTITGVGKLLPLYTSPELDSAAEHDLADG